MEKAAGNVLKSSDVKLEGKVHLDMTQPNPMSHVQRPALQAASTARIVQNTPEFTIAEVICSCGVKTSIKCDYPAGA